MEALDIGLARATGLGGAAPPGAGCTGGRGRDETGTAQGSGLAVVAGDDG